MTEPALRLPPEWHRQEWLWIGFPHDADEWPGFLESAQEQIAAFADAVAESGQDVRLVVRDGVNAARAEAFGVTVREVPSPGRVMSGDRIEPASYMNFAVTSHLVVVPIYGSVHDAEGVAAITGLFPGRAVIGLMADAILAGGGSFHCASQQMPAAQD